MPWNIQHVSIPGTALEYSTCPSIPANAMEYPKCPSIPANAMEYPTFSLSLFNFP
jgi:hypothetical protein